LNQSAAELITKKNYVHDKCRAFITSIYLHKEYLNNPAVSASPIPEGNARALDCGNILKIYKEKANRENTINHITSQRVVPRKEKEKEKLLNTRSCTCCLTLEDIDP
jgi:hypothetical protein